MVEDWRFKVDGLKLIEGLYFKSKSFGFYLGYKFHYFLKVQNINYENV